MLTINVHQAKTQLSHYLDLVSRGERVIVAKRNVPIAELKPLKKTTTPRQIGLAKGEVTLLNSFFKPLPQKIVNAFNNPK